MPRLGLRPDENSGEVSEEDVPLPNLEDGLRLLEEEASTEEGDVLQDLPEPEGGDDLNCLDVDGEVTATEEENEPKEVLPEKDRVQKDREDMEAATKPIRVQNIVFFEPLASRHASEILKGLDVIWNQCRALGIPAYRFHTDRAKEFLSHQVQRWVSQHGMTQTMTAGDDGPANGRIESEVNQVERRLRLIMGASLASKEEWPSVARHAAQERQRAQLQKLGLPQRPMIPYNQKVKTKVWRKRYSEGMSNPYLQGTLKGPSPMMNGGWVIQDKDGKIQHARTALVPDPNADKAMLELVHDVDKPDRRLVGKQPLHPTHKIPAPRLLPDGAKLEGQDDVESGEQKEDGNRAQLQGGDGKARTSRLHCAAETGTAQTHVLDEEGQMKENHCKVGNRGVREPAGLHEEPQRQDPTFGIASPEAGGESWCLKKCSLSCCGLLQERREGNGLLQERHEGDGGRVVEKEKVNPRCGFCKEEMWEILPKVAKINECEPTRSQSRIEGTTGSAFLLDMSSRTI